ncbi:hypothetical protein UK23_16935 [Lentzea aerocolonigenes]|uniref:Uncharacterized protein n=1 Tax=Lentzea aerocolonigenes TaxID=68170 RepID=A0A0F0H2Q8_LENAE|nr:hypothetical protein [Lentzea aerocolonigenes]KJK48562.1 hypothetical protein UK23_16935 [Lentzea aerocolonigenes]
MKDERWTIYAREEAGSWSNYYELDAKGWINRHMSLKQGDWSAPTAWGTVELEPSCDRWFGRIPHDHVDEWLCGPGIELVDPGKFDELWGLARGALGKPVELIPLPVVERPAVGKPFYDRPGYRFRMAMRRLFSWRP